jgi:hypothetical protein
MAAIHNTRLLRGAAKISTTASAPPPSPFKLRSKEGVAAELVAVVVLTISDVVPLLPEASDTLAGFNEQVGRLTA